jgi:hypothetical protein
MVERLEFDTVLKMYAHFALSAKRRESLQEFSEFNNVEYSELSQDATFNSIEKFFEIMEPIVIILSQFKRLPQADTKVNVH